MMLHGLHCSEYVDDEEELEVLLSPLGFAINGVPAAGAIMGNCLLCVVSFVLMSVLVHFLKLAGAGKKHNVEGLTDWARASALLRYPSALLQFPMFLMAGVLQCSFDIIFHPRDTLLVNGIGYFGLAISIATVGVFYKTSAVPKAELRPASGRSPISVYFFGAENWVSTTEHPLYVERYGLVFDPHTACVWLKGKFFAVELLILFPLSALVNVRSATWTVCTLRVVTMAVLLLVHGGLIIANKVFLMRFLTHTVAGNDIFMAVGLLLYAVAFMMENMNHWATDTAQYLFSIATVLCLLRALYDLVTYLWDVLSGMKKKKPQIERAEMPVESLLPDSELLECTVTPYQPHIDINLKASSSFMLTKDRRSFSNRSSCSPLSPNFYPESSRSRASSFVSSDMSGTYRNRGRARLSPFDTGLTSPLAGLTSPLSGVSTPLENPMSSFV